MIPMAIEQPNRPNLGPSINLGWYALLACIVAKNTVPVNDVLYDFGIFPGSYYRPSANQIKNILKRHKKAADAATPTATTK